jgi:hypothetical protein
MNRTSALAAATALALCAFAGAASAAESLPSRAVGAIGAVIAAQGDDALIQIGREFKESALEAMKPFLPEPAQAPEPAQPAETPVAQR